MVKIREKQTEQLEKAASKGLKLGGWKKMTLSSKIAAVVLVLVALTAILAPLLAPYSPVEIFTARQAPGNGFIFGTDDKGRDILSRMLYGGRYSLIIGFGATAMALVCGSVVGALAAVSRKAVSETIMRILDIIMSIPGIALAAVFVSILGNSVPSIIFAIGFMYTPQIARIVRANIVSEYGEDYVRAVIVSGAKAPWILIKHVLRNCIAPIMVFTVTLVADAIIFEASLTFIGAGIQEPTATWGNILADARGGVLAGRWWQALFPGLAIMITCLALNILSEGITDAMAAAPSAALDPTDSSKRREADLLVSDPVRAYKEQAQSLSARLHAKYLKPVSDEPVPLVLQFHGYPGASRSWFEQASFAGMGMALIALDCPGQGGPSEDIGGFEGTTVAGHIVAGIDGDPANLYYVRLHQDIRILCRIVRELEGIDLARVFVNGASQGGGLGIATCALNSELINRAAILYPFLSDFLLVWDLDADDIAYEGLRYWSRWFDEDSTRIDEAYAKLAYFDSKNFAPMVKCPVLFGTGTADIVCPPATQFAVYNNLTCEKRHEFFEGFGHEEIQDFDDMIIPFFCEGGEAHD